MRVSRGELKLFIKTVAYPVYFSYIYSIKIKVMLFTFIQGLLIGVIYGIISYVSYLNIRKFFFLIPLLLLLMVSCSKEEIFFPICIEGDCNAQFYIDYPQDENGYYHVDLDFTQKYLPRFNIEVDASITHPRWWYNDSPVVLAVFETDTYWKYQYDILPVVQGTRIYFNQYSQKRASTKRIVGPFPKEMVGDTVTISPTIMWDAGNSYDKRTFLLKFIIK